jgi:hypothetical protein
LNAPDLGHHRQAFAEDIELVSNRESSVADLGDNDIIVEAFRDVTDHSSLSQLLGAAQRIVLDEVDDAPAKGLHELSELDEHLGAEDFIDVAVGRGIAIVD